METINHISKKELQRTLKELVDWIDSQDLIKRKDVKAIFNEHIWDWQCGADEAYDELLELPKAEPPFANDISVPDKLATDTNVAHKEGCEM